MEERSLDIWLKQIGTKPLDAQALNYCSANFKSDRKNLTMDGKLNFKHSNFEGQDLRGVNLTIFDLGYSTFSHTKVDREGFCYLISDKTLLLKGVDLTGLNLSNLDLYGFNIKGVEFRNAIINRSTLLSLLPAAKAKEISLKGVNLSKVDLSGCNINDPTLGIDGFNFFDLGGIELDEANFEAANLSGVVMNNSSFKRANFNNAYIIGSYATDADFSEATFKKAKLCHSDFSRSLFNKSDLTNAEV